MGAGIVDEAGVFSSPIGIETQLRIVEQHLRKSNDDVERRPQLMAHGREEAAFRGIGSIGFHTCLFERPFLNFALADIAHDRDNLARVGAGRIAGRSIEQATPHFDPNEQQTRGLSGIPPDPKFDRSILAEFRCLERAVR